LAAVDLLFVVAPLIALLAVLLDIVAWFVSHQAMHQRA
jgi:hypothetical protein